MKTLLTLFFLALSSLAYGKDVYLENLNTTIPSKIGKYAFEEKIDYEKTQGLGYELRFRSEDGLISIFVYDINFKNIPEGISAELIKEEHSFAKDDVKKAESMGRYRNVKDSVINPSLNKELQGKYLTASYTFDIPSGGCKSYLLVRGYNGQFLKIRATLYIVNDVVNEDGLLFFLKTLNEKLKPL